MKKQLTLALVLAITLTFTQKAAAKKPPEKAAVGTFTDIRDNKTYKTAKIGTQVWMAENLNIEIEKGNSKCYDDYESNCQKYGRLYDWETARKACPKGWHMPSDAEWDKLDSISGTPGKDLKAKSGWDNCTGEDKFGFAALPGGNSGYNDGNSENDGFNRIGYGGFWWTATKIDSIYAFSRYMDCLDANTLYASNGKKSDLYSVRCVKD